jgi:hypothetical protein
LLGVCPEDYPQYPQIPRSGRENRQKGASNELDGTPSTRAGACSFTVVEPIPGEEALRRQRKAPAPPSCSRFQEEKRLSYTVALYRDVPP